MKESSKALRNFHHFARVLRITLVGLAIAWAVASSGSVPDPLVTNFNSSPKSTVERIKSAIHFNDPHSALPLIVWPRSISEKERLAQAKEFLSLFDLYAILPVGLASEQPEGNLNDYRETGIDIVGTFQFPSNSVPIQLERSDDPSDNSERTWKVSRQTVEAVLDAGKDPNQVIESLIPQDSRFAFLHHRWWGISLWQWFSALLVVVLSALIGKVCASMLDFSLRKIALIAKWPVPSKLLGFTFPLSIIIATIFFRMALPHLGIGISIRDILLSIASLLKIYAGTLLVIRAIIRFIDAYEASLRRSGREQLISLLQPLRRVISAVAIVIGIIVSLRVLGYDVSALLAGLGVGGLAIALAAQKTVENLFGGLSVVLDQPVRVGDFCRAGDVSGTVEDIGLRSTRLRTLDRTLLTIPNADFSQLKLENFAARDSIRFAPIIGIRYDTTPDQVRLVLHKLREFLSNHPKVLPGPRVRFINLGSSALEIEIFSYLATTDYAEFLGYKEEMNLNILDILRECGTECSFNTSVQYHAPLEALPQNLQVHAAAWAKTKD